MTSINDIAHMTAIGLQSNIENLTFDKIFHYSRGLETVKPSTPILVLIHGYPQSNFMWRHILALLPSDIPLFVPDIPGYGRSATLSKAHTKGNVGEAILAALESLLPHSENQAIIIAGHDRGARIGHRLGVDRSIGRITVKAVIHLDIVPSVVQYNSFGTATAAVNTFHWPFLANVEIATSMINAFGGDKWCRFCLDRWGTKDAAKMATFHANEAMQVYTDFFKDNKVVRASCEDYRAGAFEDVEEQEQDQKNGKKLDVNTLVIYSADYLGKRYDVEQVWSAWMGTGILSVRAIGDGAGHFFAEEVPDETAILIKEFYLKESTGV